MTFQQIASFDNFMLANMTLGLLQENNLNCHLKDEHIVTIDPLLTPAVGGIKLMVEERDVEEAIMLIKQAETDYLAEIDCPNCKKRSLVIEEKRNTPETFWGKLFNRVAYGQEEIYSKKYRCRECNMLYDELPPSF